MGTNRGCAVRSRATARRRWLLAALSVVLLGVLSGCEAQISSQLDAVRAGAGVATLPTSTDLSNAARAHSTAMCSAKAVAPSTAPVAAYDEGPDQVHELVGSASLDPTISNGADRNVAATNAIWAQWSHDPELHAAKWTTQGIGEAQCSDGKLYMTLVLQGPNSTMPASGLYSTPQFDTAQEQAFSDLIYGSAVDVYGNTIQLGLDLYLPPAPAPTPSPLIIMIHGGAFAGGSRTDLDGVAQNWVTRGFAVASIDYRLDPLLNGPHTATDELQAATNAILDAQQSVRWLKGNAATYHLDTTRIAAIGFSAGGGVSLGLAGAPDPHPGGPYSTYSPSITAAVSTGAYLTPGLDAGVLHFVGTEAPILMFHYETDVASAPGPYAYETCTAYHQAGDTCDYISQAGEGHTTDLDPGSVWWADPIGPFIWEHLHLSA
jgi:dienelactone hydrolase